MQYHPRYDELDLLRAELDQEDRIRYVNAHDPILRIMLESSVVLICQLHPKFWPKYARRESLEWSNGEMERSVAELEQYVRELDEGQKGSAYH